MKALYMFALLGLLLQGVYSVNARVLEMGDTELGYLEEMVKEQMEGDEDEKMPMEQSYAPEDTAVRGEKDYNDIVQEEDYDDALQQEDNDDAFQEQYSNTIGAMAVYPTNEVNGQEDEGDNQIALKQEDVGEDADEQFFRSLWNHIRNTHNKFRNFFNSVNNIKQRFFRAIDPRIYSGNTIALQTTRSHQWASCVGHHCSGNNRCPGAVMYGHTWNRCWGEVFQIYRRNGGGVVRVGDYVGIYYPRERKWLGCAGSVCGKAPCPGSPNSRCGFQDSGRWHSCWGEVFQIYAMGRGNGSPITIFDRIMLRYSRDGSYLSHPGHYLHKNRCPGHGIPGVDKYSRCYGEVFSLTKHR